MSGEIEDRDAFVECIGYALKQHGALPSRKKQPDQRERDATAARLARAVADHLILSNWIVTRGDPLPMRTTAQFPPGSGPHRITIPEVPGDQPLVKRGQQ